MKKKLVTGLATVVLSTLAFNTNVFASNGDIDGNVFLLPNNEARDNAFFQTISVPRSWFAGYEQVEVSLLDAASGNVVSTILSGNNAQAQGYGAFTFRGVPDGTYRIRVAPVNSDGVEHVSIPALAINNSNNEYFFQDTLVSELIYVKNGEIVNAQGQIYDTNEYVEGIQAPQFSFAVVRRPWALDVATDIGSFLLTNGTATKEVNYFPGGVQTGVYSNRGYMAVLGALSLDTFGTAITSRGTSLVPPVLSDEEVRFGYSFLGWSIDESSLAAYPELAPFKYIPMEQRTEETLIRALSTEQVLSFGAKGDLKLHAEFTAPIHVVRFSTDLEKGKIEGQGTKTFVAYGNLTKLPELPVPTPEAGYEFVGWFVDLTTNTVPENVILGNNIVGNQVYYAKYRKIPVTQEISKNPVVLRLVEGDKEVKGLGIAGSSLTVTFKNGTSVETTVGQDGAWTVAVPEAAALVNGDNVSAVQIEEGKLRSSAVDGTVVKENVAPTTEVSTRFVDESGLDIANQEKGTKEVKTIKGYEFVRTVVDINGNTVHIYKQIVVPGAPTPENNTPVSSGDAPANMQTTTGRRVNGASRLPYTGTAETPVLFAGSVLSLFGLLFAWMKRK
ncbi:InlB B-repeat-containing protein [Carnobacteriaceae bacterium zg-C25]|nr:InlB B-repeat-containing protein [Carnobacteriaceae bacterium zg-C25]